MAGLKVPYMAASSGANCIGITIPVGIPPANITGGAMAASMLTGTEGTALPPNNAMMSPLSFFCNVDAEYWLVIN